MPPGPKRQPRLSEQSFSEKVQWILLIGGLISLYIIVFFQRSELDDLNRRLRRATEGNDAAISAIERRLLEFGIPELAPRVGVLPAKPPANIGIFGSRATLTVPGNFKIVQKERGYTLVGPSNLRVQIETVPIREEELQKWFALNRANFEPPRSRPVVGPNQVLVSGQLAIDETLTLADASLRRITYVRDGGSVIVFSASALVEDSDAAFAEWEKVLATLAFPQ